MNGCCPRPRETVGEGEHERGCLAEERVLGGDLTYHRPEERLEAGAAPSGGLHF